MNHAEYVNIEAVNWSTLKYMRDSPLAYHHALTSPDEDTVGRAKGRVLHTLVFEPEKFAAEYAVYSGPGTRAGKEYREWAARQPATSTLLKEEEVADARAAAEAIRRHAAVIPYLTGGQFEKVVRWKHGATGLDCKGRMDLWHGPTRTLIDLKSTTTIHPHYFGRIVARQGYHCQLAHYADGIRTLTNREPAQVIILAVQTKAPYDLAMFKLSPDDLYAGKVEVDGLLQRVAECRAAGQWPGRFPIPVPLQLPAYIWGDDENPADLDVQF